jgi:hypothetical protein
VHFIRHAEGTHNEAARLYGEESYKDWAWEVRVRAWVGGWVDRWVGRFCVWASGDWGVGGGWVARSVDWPGSGLGPSLIYYIDLEGSIQSPVLTCIYVRLLKASKPRPSLPHPNPQINQDAELTEVGRQQCLRLHRRLLQSRLMETIDLVVASPLRRTLHTASLAFGEGSGKGDGEGEGRKRFLRPHVPPVVAVEAIRETAGAGFFFVGGGRGGLIYA